MAAGIEKDETLQQTVLRAKLRFLDKSWDQMDWKKKWCWRVVREAENKDGQGKGGWTWYNETTGMNLAELRDATAERRKWRSLTMVIAKVPGTDSTRWQGERLIYKTTLFSTGICCSEAVREWRWLFLTAKKFFETWNIDRFGFVSTHTWCNCTVSADSWL